MGLDSRISCHSDVDASKFASSKLKSTSSLERESMDGSKCLSALDSSPIATPKLVASSGVAQGDLNGKGASHFFGTHTSKPKFHCTFCKKDGHTVEFFFRRVKHERRVRAKAFKKPRSLPHGMCDSNVGTKSSIDASCSKSQWTAHLQENGDSSTRTMPLDRPLYHCSLLGKDGHQESFAATVQGKCGELVLLGLWLFISLLMAWILMSLKTHNLWMGFITLFLVS
jgi:hypothetical protein